MSFLTRASAFFPFLSTRHILFFLRLTSLLLNLSSFFFFFFT
jgi:hypothetical protein